MLNGIQTIRQTRKPSRPAGLADHLLGYRSNRELLENTKTADEDSDGDGRSFFSHHRIACGDQVKIPWGDSRNACLQKWRCRRATADSRSNGKDRGVLPQMEGAAHVAIRLGAA
jgi:hypothetical protein